MGLGLAMAVVALADAPAAPDDTVFVNADNYTFFANSNEALLKGKPRGIVMEFPGLGGGSCLGGRGYPSAYTNAPFPKATAAAGLVHLYLMPSPWSWMNQGAVRTADLVVDAVRAKFGLAADTPLVATGGSMGGLGALVYAAKSRHRVTACAAACPCYDVPALYACKDSFRRTYLSAVASLEMPIAKGLETISPAHLIDSMPYIPYHIVCDGADEVFPEAGMDAYVARLRASGRQVEYVKLPGLKHGHFTPDARTRFNEFVCSAGRVNGVSRRIDAVKPAYSFVLGKRTYADIPEGWTRSVTTSHDRRDGAGRTTEKTVGRSPDGAMEMTVTVTRYDDDPVVEWTIGFANTGEKDSERFTRISSGDFDLPFDSSAPLKLWRGIGETGMRPQPYADEKNYSFWYSDLTNGVPETLSCEKGYPTFKGFSYFRTFSPTNGYTVAIGWQGWWSAKVEKGASGAHVVAGQHETDFYLKPGERIISPTVTVLAFTDHDDAVNSWRRFMRRWILPREKTGETIRPILALDVTFGGRLYTQITAQGEIDRIRAVRAKGLKFDALWVDAGWYCRDDVKNADGTRAGWWAIGEWRCDMKRFPEGSFWRVSEELAKDGAYLVLWHEPERIVSFHPAFTNVEKYLSWHGDTDPAKHIAVNCCYDLTRSEVVDFVAAMINASLAANRVGFFRQDMNTGTAYDFWHDRIDLPRGDGRRGIAENLYIQGEFSLWGKLKAANPHMFFDTCSGGGRRNDLSTLRFPSVPLHYTDTGSTNYVHKLHYHHMLAEWLFYRKDIPYFYHFGPGRFADMRAATIDFASMHVVTANRYLSDNPRFKMQEDAYLKVWRKLSPLLVDGDYYLLTQEVTPDVDGDRIWWVAQYHDPVHNRGFVKVVRSPGCQQSSIQVRLKGVTPGRRYELVDEFAPVEYPARAPYPVPPFVGGETSVFVQPAASGSIYSYGF